MKVNLFYVYCKMPLYVVYKCIYISIIIYCTY